MQDYLGLNSNSTMNRPEEIIDKIAKINRRIDYIMVELNLM